MSKMAIDQLKAALVRRPAVNVRPIGLEFRDDRRHKCKSCKQWFTGTSDQKMKKCRTCHHPLSGMISIVPDGEIIDGALSIVEPGWMFEEDLRQTVVGGLDSCDILVKPVKPPKEEHY